MNGWALATEAAIWVLIGGSVLVFGWFLAEVIRLGRKGGTGGERGPEGGRGAGERQ